MAAPAEAHLSSRKPATVDLNSADYCCKLGIDTQGKLAMAARSYIMDDREKKACSSN